MTDLLQTYPQIKEDINKSDFNNWKKLADIYLSASIHCYLQAIKSDQNNVKSRLENLDESDELENLINYHLNTQELDLSYAISSITIEEGYVNKKYYLENELDEYYETIQEYKDKHQKIINLINNNLSQELISQIDTNPLDYYIKNI